jgi:hypothetical protein
MCGKIQNIYQQLGINKPRLNNNNKSCYYILNSLRRNMLLYKVSIKERRYIKSPVELCRSRILLVEP